MYTRYTMWCILQCFNLYTFCVILLCKGWHPNQIWHVCNNLLDAMVQVPYLNCFSLLKKNSQALREERTLHQPMMNNETIMLSACATLLRDTGFGIRFLVKNVTSFSFTLGFFFFISFLLPARKRRKQLALSAV